jgi:uncharacterized membrane protein YbjE (DUF340 family)
MCRFKPHALFLMDVLLQGFHMFWSMLLIFLPLFIGFFVPVPRSSIPVVSKATQRIIYLILALMGLSIAQLDNLAQNLAQIGHFSFIFFAVLSVSNLVALHFLNRHVDIVTQAQLKQLPLGRMALESLKLIVVVGAGFLLGLAIQQPITWLDSLNEIILMLLLFLIGIELGNSGMSLKQIFVNRNGILIAVTVALSSWLGGIACSVVLDIPVHQALALSSGFGWYSLAGILMTDHLGPVYGGASFIIELGRELVALVLIPFFMIRKPATAIGYAGATAMDFTLPVIQASGGIRCVPVAIVSGFLLSLAVPFFMLFFVSLGG